LELFILKRKIKGPLWIKIKGFKNNNSKLSWCRSEIIVDNLKNIEVMSDQRESPKLSILSLKIGAIFNEESKINEVLNVSGVLIKEINIDTQTDYKNSNYLKFNGNHKI
jgi:DNA polymerase alpha subunit A